MSSVPVSPERDGVLRLCARMPLGPYGLGLAASAGFVLLMLTWTWLTGAAEILHLPDGSWSGRRLFSEAVNVVLFGFGVAATGVARLGARADLERLRPALRGRDDRPLRALLVPGPWLALSAPVLAALGGLLMVNDPSVWDDQPRPEFPDPWLIWTFTRNTLLGLAVFWLALTEVKLTLAFARIGAEHIRVDLLDSRPLEPFARKGQRSVVIWILFSSIFSLFWVQGSAASLNSVTLAAIVSLATLAFLMPLSGARRSIVEAKRVELERVNAAIREERAALWEEAEAGQTPRLSNLIAYRGLVAAAHEWPLSATALLRFGLFLLLGLGSWLGAALVERFLERALG